MANAQPLRPAQNIRHWLVAGVVVLNLIFALLIAHSLKHGYDDQLQRAQVQAGNMALSVESDIASSLRSADLSVQSLIDEYLHQLALGRIDGTALQAHIDRLRGRLPVIESMHVVSARGRVLYGTGLDPANPIELSDRAHFIQLRDTPTSAPVLTPPLSSRATGQRVIFLARRIDRGGQFAGIVTASVLVDKLSDLLQSLEHGPGGVIALRDSQLRPIIRHPLAAPSSQAPVAPSQLTEQIQRGLVHGQFRTISPVDGVDRVVAFRKMVDWPFVITSGVSVEDALSAWYGEVGKQLGLLALFALLTAVGGYLLARTWRRAQESLRQLDQQRSLFRTVADFAYDWEIWLDPHGRMLYCSPACQRITGHRSVEFFASPRLLVALAHPEDKVTVASHFFPTGSDSAVSPALVFRLLHMDDAQTVWVECSSQKVEDGEGQPKGWRHSLRDISQRHRLEDTAAAAHEALERKQQQLETIIEHLPAIFVLKDREGRHLMVNARFEAVTGFSRDEVIGRTDNVFFPKDNAETIRTRDAAIIAKGEVTTFEQTLPHRDGTPHHYLTTKVPMRDAQGQVEALMGMTTDITDLKQLQQELTESRDAAERLSQAKSEFLTNMSHEIRTPMSGVIGMAELLSHTALDDKQQRLLGTLRDSANAQLAILNDILDFSMIEAGRLDLSREPFVLHELLGKAAAVFGTQARLKHLTIRASLDPALPRALLGDPLRIYQILTNLLSNAIKFSQASESPTEVEVSARRLDEAGPTLWLALSVRDHGIGMDETTQSRLFTPFSQADNSSTRRHGGTGLGLAICHRLAQLMGGRMEVESAPGAGATFTVCLPLAPAQLPQLPHAELPPTTSDTPTPTSATTSPHLILVAEDNDTNQEVIEQQLLLLGHRCELADNGRDALAMWIKGSYDLVISDIHMPYMDGYQLATAIREEERRRGQGHIPIVALTANILTGEADRCLAAGMDAYLAKPAQLPTLKSTLDRLLSCPAARGGGEPPVQTPPPTESEAAAPEAADTEQLPVFDPDWLGTMLGNNASMHRRLLEKFLSGAQSHAAQIRAACQDGQALNAGKVAHTLKSGARSVGAKRLGDLCEKLERAGKAGELDNCRALLDQLDPLLEETRTTIEREKLQP